MNDVKLAQSVVTDCLRSKICEHRIEIANLESAIVVVESCKRLSDCIRMIDADSTKLGVTSELNALRNLLAMNVGNESPSIVDVVNKLRGLVKE